MKKTVSVFILLLCFGLSSANAALAAEIVNSSPIIVQPYDEDLREISQQMLEQDRINRDQESAVRGFMGEDQKPTDTALARQEDGKLEQINHTLAQYRDFLLSRQQARIAAESPRVSKYHDLIALTEDVDNIKGVGQPHQLKTDVIEEKYKILADLKDEMTALNEKLDTDQRIVQLNDAVRWLKQVLAAAKNKAEYDRLTFVFLKKEARRLRLQLSRQENKQAQGQTRMEQDLKAQLQDKKDRITAMIQSAQKAQAQADILRQQLVDEKNKVDLLKQELESKITQSNEMTLLLEEYRKKLESKHNSTDEQLRQLLSFKNYQAQMEAQIADLNARLQEKEGQIIKIKKQMYDLQESVSARERDIQSKDLNLSMVQQRMMEEKVNGYQKEINGLHAANTKQSEEIKQLRTELALVRQQLIGMPTGDEIDFLRTGLTKATAQLKQKEAMLRSVKADADKYEKEFNGQSEELQRVKGQLQSAYEEINSQNEDLKYKNMAIIRLKERLAIQGKPNENNAQALPKGDHLREKLKQALDEIVEQERVIDVLVRKLQESGQNVNLTKYFTKQ